jgi:hypothetical protein
MYVYMQQRDLAATDDTDERSNYIIISYGGSQFYYYTVPERWEPQMEGSVWISKILEMVRHRCRRRNNADVSYDPSLAKG